MMVGGELGWGGGLKQNEIGYRMCLKQYQLNATTIVHLLITLSYYTTSFH